MSHIGRHGLISPEYDGLTIVGQSKLMGLHRSRYYFRSKGDSPFNQLMMNVINRKFR